MTIWIVLLFFGGLALYTLYMQHNGQSERDEQNRIAASKRRMP